MKDWFYDETSQVGVDYGDKAEADVYDERMERFRNYAQEARTFVEKLNFPDLSRITAIDIGCGTGAFAVHAAKYLKQVHAVDVSGEMLRIARSKAEGMGVSNIHFHQAGYLDFTAPKPVEVINTKWALHHLPDYWKQAALLRMNQMLKPGGVLLITDWVFLFDPDFERAMDEVVTEMSRNFSQDFVREAKGHLREEFSTFDWVLRGMIERAGFEIEHADLEVPLAAEYVCRKV
ncbi:MAG: methyltransferase domain-containing protein [Proteobacteria bacterium]|nr:methyltransferase domain-containing protein [Pseudomonadota bacterium]MBU1611456.1 methyltransferase domain-containing protein [Pseudomonadota bacterium]